MCDAIPHPRPTVLALVAVLACAGAIIAGCAAPTPTLQASVAPATASPATPAPSSSASAPAASTPVVTPGTGSASDRPDLAAVRVAVEDFAGDLDQPVLVSGAGDGSGRLYVAEQPGRIRVIENGVVSATPFLDIADRVTAGGERGLLGVAFPPGFGAERPLVYVHYSGEGGATVVSEFRLDAHDVAVLDAASERTILTEPQPYPNHNGGWIGFDADGMLLIALGDGGAGGDPENRATNLKGRLGKMLRIDVLGAPAGQPYGIPADNPWANGDDQLPEILHFGLRNPFRSSIDPLTGDLWIGDVGQGAWEEVDVARAGARGLDFGWRRWEGRHCFEPSTGCDPDGVTMPVAEYGHGAGCSVIGGVVYRGAAIPALRGAYLFSDYCSGTLWAIDSTDDGAQQPTVLLETGSSISAIGAGDDGEVYLTDLARGNVLRLLAGG
ncbi:MAG TPA: PQQ-dependent sugar dehydrogenase [Candidatus Limnocylindrales bacterium]|nr:PQQ-dependent sugar dehydrogenase [Candidatus Limnocylindrales bacterium]